MARNLYDLGDRTPDQSDEAADDTPESRSRIVPIGMVLLALIVAGAAIFLFRTAMPASTGNMAPAETATLITTEFALCDDPRGQACVLSPDSYAYAGRRYHLSDIRVPSQTGPACEAKRAHEGRIALAAMLNGGSFQALPDSADTDTSARLLVRDGVSLGQLMILKRYAKPWSRTPIDWCAGV